MLLLLLLLLLLSLYVGRGAVLNMMMMMMHDKDDDDECLVCGRAYVPVFRGCVGCLFLQHHTTFYHFPFLYQFISTSYLGGMY